MDVLDRLNIENIRVSVTDDGRLAASPRGRITREIAGIIRTHRDDIIRHLTAVARIRAWLAHIRETDPEIIDDVLARCADDPDCLAYYLTRAAEMPRTRRVVGRTVHGAEVVVEEVT